MASASRSSCRARSRCADNGDAVWYGRIAFFTTKRIVRIPAGGEFSSHKPNCGLSEPKPV